MATHAQKARRNRSSSRCCIGGKHNLVLQVQPGRSDVVQRNLPPIPGWRRQQVWPGSRIRIWQQQVRPRSRIRIWQQQVGLMLGSAALSLYLAGSSRPGSRIRIWLSRPGSSSPRACCCVHAAEAGYLLGPDPGSGSLPGPAAVSLWLRRATPWQCRFSVGSAWQQRTRASTAWAHRACW